jgi:hypothetical protein
MVRVKVYNARLALIMFYNARQVLNTRTTSKKITSEKTITREKNDRSREKFIMPIRGREKRISSRRPHLE